jgi:hypothetical protein
MLLTYVWAHEILFFANKVDDTQRTPRVFRGSKQTLSFWLAVGAVLFLIAWFNSSTGAPSFILGSSQFWEASLAIPYGGWGYHPDQMMGIFLKVHCDLPIEVVLVWTRVAWTTIIVYETILTAIHAWPQRLESLHDAPGPGTRARHRQTGLPAKRPPMPLTEIPLPPRVESHSSRLAAALDHHTKV